MSLISTRANIFIPGNPCKYQNKTFTLLLREIKRYNSKIYILIEKYVKVLNSLTTKSKHFIITL